MADIGPGQGKYKVILERFVVSESKEVFKKQTDGCVLKGYRNQTEKSSVVKY